MPLKTIIDCHTHSSFSPDSIMPVHEGAQAALACGLGGLIFTDHIDLDYLDYETGLISDHALDIQKRDEVLACAQAEFTGRLKILNGVEIGFQPHLVDTLQKTVRENNFDFVLCSVHIVGRQNIGRRDFYGKMSKRQAYQKYLEEIFASVCSGIDFDAIGHIGYMCRYAPYQDRSMVYQDYGDILDAIFKKLIELGKGIEVNTSGLVRGHGFTHPEYSILKRYKECGGQVLTMGSDAHDAGAIGGAFKVVRERLCDLGFRYVTYFEKRKPVFVKIT